MSYFNSMNLHLIKTDLNKISLAIKLLKCDEIFVIFDFYAPISKKLVEGAY